MSGRTFLDTNVLVYLFDRDSPSKQAKSRELLTSLGPPGDAILSTQVLQEFYVVVTRKLATPLKPEPALAAVREWMALPVVSVATDTVLNAILKSQAYHISFWDALIVQAAIEGGCGRLLTEDLQHGQVIEGLVIENPFRD